MTTSMNTSNPMMASPGLQPGLAERIRHSKALIPTLAVLAVTVAALGATLAVKQSGAQTGAYNGSQALVAPMAQPAMTQPSTGGVQPGAVQAPARVVAQAQPNIQPNVQPAAPIQPVQPVRPVQSHSQYQVASRAPAACTHCGVVESVVAVKRQQPVQGIGGTQITPGAVAGGVIGGLLGNQVGHGNGRAAATVLGAAGGAYAGNAIQKNMNTYTAYQVQVRMNNGTLRTVEQRNAPAIGAQVRVDGHTLRPLGAAQG